MLYEKCMFLKPDLVRLDEKIESWMRKFDTTLMSVH